ncbi:itaconate degradation C-C-lyase RipC [Sphingomonas sp. PAMC 26605]|uniref:itaconate degradation C-C-lyase RipC n=1 Tax=Sphingomonas sp. PAMC 26605 TaxID=1112214 RepID=UPI00026CDE35|nr:itaconate degradation C-C-lyase RipC [Sphingomonas sp. PAMC 26605]
MPHMSSEPTRSWLFTPGTRPERFAKAAEISADVLIIDLEDAVAPADKDGARTVALDWLAANASTPSRIGHALRVNGLDTAAGIADLHALIRHTAVPDYLVIPKVESAGHVEIMDRLLTSAGKDTRLVAIIESVRGLREIEAIAGASGRLVGLMFGAADMAADLGCVTAWEPLVSVRAQIVAACALATIAPIDTPFFDVRDTAGCAAEAKRAVDHGFIAKAAIHPSQIAPINAVLTPSAAAIEAARSIVATNINGVGTVDGKMIDEAVARKARRVLAAAG